MKKRPKKKTRPIRKTKAKRTKKKVAAKPKPKSKLVKPAKMKVPANLLTRLVKKFRVRKTSTTLVLVLSAAVGYDVIVVTKKHPEPVVLRTLNQAPLTNGSQLPESFWVAYARRFSIWYGRHLSLHQLVPPGVRKERSKRKSLMRKLLQSHQDHMATKHTMRVVVGVAPRRTEPQKRRMPRFTYICVYDPKSRPNRPKQPTTFMMHNPVCASLDGRRKTAQKHGGDSWVLEGEGVEDAVREQLVEFDTDDMGYDRSDFSIHTCVSTRR